MQRLCSANQRDERSVHGAVKTPPRRSQSSSVGRQEAPSQALWYIAPSRPRPNMSSRLLPHAVTAGGLVNTPPSLSQSSSDGRQALPSQALWYIAPSVPRPNMSSRLLPQEATHPLEGLSIGTGFVS